MTPHKFDTSDLTWKPATAVEWKAVVVYQEITKRDWRWLWLRKTTHSKTIEWWTT